MKTSIPEMTQRFLTLLKVDSFNLMNRIIERQEEYLNDFSLKRDRAIFTEIFYNRYATTSMNDLAQLPIEIIELANDFYTQVDNLRWYLMHTQDMPNTIEEEIQRQTASLKKKQDNLLLYINVELAGEDMSEPQMTYDT
ncbi:MAG: hypothetical protein VYA54_00475 [Bdellovibrionota bacterium]|nr:hypothetical protein [Bdellovibrionota bacterium]